MHTDLPLKIRHIPHPPKQLFSIGTNLEKLLKKPCVAIVGSRKVSPYGIQVTTMLARELAQTGVVVVSGLAIGVDSIAHRAALDAGGQTIAVLPAGLDDIYPRSHQALARHITQQGGALVSEYPPETPAYPSNFIARNRITSGLSDAVVVTEAAERSGTLSTARFALEQGKELLAVPGNITSPTSAGTNNLIKAGAAPVTSVEDVLYVLGITPVAPTQAPHCADPHEQAILILLHSGTTSGSELLVQSVMPVNIFNQTLTMLEIKGMVRPLGNNHWGLTQRSTKG
jgi:DNA processing protein